MNANFRSKFRNELSVKANFRSKIRVNYNNRHCENSANFLRTFALDKYSPFFVEKPRNSRISSNYVLITFSQYCIKPCYRLLKKKSSVMLIVESCPLSCSSQFQKCPKASADNVLAGNTWNKGAILVFSLFFCSLKSEKGGGEALL